MIFEKGIGGKGFDGVGENPKKFRSLTYLLNGFRNFFSTLATWKRIGIYKYVRI
jgi:hypothetical protein